MKSKYCFLRTNGHLCPDDVIYIVWVGSYFRELAKLALVEEYCKDVGFYIEKWSFEVDSKLESERDRFRKDGDPFANPFMSAEVSIGKLYAMIIDDSFGRFESELHMTDFEKWQRFRNTVEYHQSKSKSQARKQKSNDKLKVLQNASPSERKYLSHRCSRDCYKAVIALLAILGLFLADACVSYVISRLFLTSF